MGENTLSAEDRMDAARARALHAAMGLDGAPPDDGDPLPPFWHQIYFWDVLPPESLGPDGHPAVGGLVPDLGLPRRMWAGGSVTWHAPLRTGIRAQKTTRVLNVTRKQGRTGQLGFVTLRHEIRQRGALAVTEDQDLVYRPLDAPPASPPLAPETRDRAAPLRCDTTLLFRYSALTMNGHRIHYDADYARGREGYPGLVVHGPLLATFLMMQAARVHGDLHRFTFRSSAPICLPETALICREGGSHWIEGSDGRLCMMGQAET